MSGYDLLLYSFYSILLLLPYIGTPFLSLLFPKVSSLSSLLILLHVACIPVMVTNSYIVACLGKAYRAWTRPIQDGELAASLQATPLGQCRFALTVEASLMEILKEAAYNIPLNYGPFLNQDLTISPLTIGLDMKLQLDTRIPTSTSMHHSYTSLTVTPSVAGLLVKMTGMEKLNDLKETLKVTKIAIVNYLSELSKHKFCYKR